MTELAVTRGRAGTAGRRRGRARRERRGLVAPHAERHRVLPVRRKRDRGDRAHPPARAQRRRVPRPHRRASAPARATGCGRMAPGTRRAAIGSIPAKLLVDPFATEIDRPFRLRPGDVRHRRAEPGRQRGRDAEGASSARRSHPGAAPAAASVPGRPRHLRAACARLHAAPSRTFRRRCAALSPALGASGRDRASAPARHHHRRADAGRRLARRAASAAARADQLLGLQSGRVPRPRSAAGARRLGRDPRRRRRPAGRRASRCCSTWCSTTPARATSSARRCRCAASTTPPTTACGRTIRAATSTIPAAATRWRSTGRRCCASRWTALRRWVRRAGSTASASISPPTLGRRADGFDPDAPLLAAIDAGPGAARPAC